MQDQNVQIGVGLRPPHYSFLKEEPNTAVQWFEAISENYMSSEGHPLEMLQFIRNRYPVALHGVGMSIGSSDGVSIGYLKKLYNLIEKIEPFIVSDHLCWSSLDGQPTHDLLPLPYTTEAVDTVVRNIDQVQSHLGRTIAIENVSTYMRFKNSEMPEWDFIREIQKKSGCELLLDINNVFVNSVNHDFRAEDYIDGLPLQSVVQIHLAGHTDTGEFLFDTHSAPVCQDVWDLLSYTRKKMSQCFKNGSMKPPAILVEWDDEIPEWPVLEQEAVRAKEIWEAAL